MMSDLVKVGPSEVKTGGLLLEVDCLLELVLGAHCLLHWLIVVSNCWSVEVGHWSVVVDHWSPVVNFWSVVEDCWFVVANCWSPVSGS